MLPHGRIICSKPIIWARNLHRKEIIMNKIFADVDVGRKNIVLGIVLFLLLGVVVGIPLTIDLLGGSILTSYQYQTWKVVHGYGVFLAFINYFLGLSIDELEVSRQQKEITSWSFLAAGLIGGVMRMILVLTLSLNVLGIYASLGESVCFIVGTFMFVRGQMKEKSGNWPERTAQARYSRAR
jgi:hypothetical protein